MNAADGIGPAERAKMRRASNASSTVQQSRGRGARQQQESARRGTSEAQVKKGVIDLTRSPATSLTTKGKKKDPGNNSSSLKSRSGSIEIQEGVEDSLSPRVAARAPSAAPPAPQPFAEAWSKVFPPLPRPSERFSSPHDLLSLLETPFTERSNPAPLALDMATSSHEAGRIRCTINGCRYTVVTLKDQRWEEGCAWEVRGEWSELQHGHAPPSWLEETEKMEGLEMARLTEGVLESKAGQETQALDLGDDKRTTQDPSLSPPVVVRPSSTQPSQRPQLTLITTTRPPTGLRRHASDDLALPSSRSFKAESLALSSRAQSSPPFFTFSPISKYNTSASSPPATSLAFCTSATSTTQSEAKVSSEPKAESTGQDVEMTDTGDSAPPQNVLPTLLAAVQPSLAVLLPNLKRLGVEDGEAFVDLVLLEGSEWLKLLEMGDAEYGEEWALLKNAMEELRAAWVGADDSEE